jgi:hypothetical protein
MMHKRWLAILVLLIAAAFRLHNVTYGLNDVCSTVPEEQWQFEQSQVVSLYTWNIKPSGHWTTYRDGSKNLCHSLLQKLQ